MCKNQLKEKDKKKSRKNGLWIGITMLLVLLTQSVMGAERIESIAELTIETNAGDIVLDPASNSVLSDPITVGGTTYGDGTITDDGTFALSFNGGSNSISYEVESGTPVKTINDDTNFRIEFEDYDVSNDNSFAYSVLPNYAQFRINPLESGQIQIRKYNASTTYQATMSNGHSLFLDNGDIIFCSNSETADCLGIGQFDAGNHKITTTGQSNLYFEATGSNFFFTTEPTENANVYLIPEGNNSQYIGFTAYNRDSANNGLLFRAGQDIDKNLLFDSHNKWTIGTGSTKLKDINSVLVNGADFIFMNSIAMTECLNDLNQIDICFVYGKPTQDQVKTMGLVHFEDYADYQANNQKETCTTEIIDGEENINCVMEFDNSMGETEFNQRRNEVMTDGKIDLTFGRTVHMSMRDVKKMVDEYPTLRTEVLNMRSALCELGKTEFC